MKEKAFTLIGLKNKGWLANEMQISVITLDKRLLNDNWKESEKLLLEKIYSLYFS
jgi:hypothetical protein